jgi:acyl-CoA reductase-like NAD-dependent aldehyde dehydrogenase
MRVFQVGDPRAAGASVGPLIDEAAFEAMPDPRCRRLATRGGQVHGGERVETSRGRRVVTFGPAIVEAVGPSARYRTTVKRSRRFSTYSATRQLKKPSPATTPSCRACPRA